MIYICFPHVAISVVLVFIPRPERDAETPTNIGTSKSPFQLDKEINFGPPVSFPYSPNVSIQAASSSVLTIQVIPPFNNNNGRHDKDHQCSKEISDGENDASKSSASKGRPRSSTFPGRTFQRPSETILLGQTYEDAYISKQREQEKMQKEMMAERQAWFQQQQQQQQHHHQQLQKLRIQSPMISSPVMNSPSASISDHPASPISATSSCSSPLTTRLPSISELFGGETSAWQSAQPRRRHTIHTPPAYFQQQIPSQILRPLPSSKSATSAPIAAQQIPPPKPPISLCAPAPVSVSAPIPIVAPVPASDAIPVPLIAAPLSSSHSATSSNFFPLCAPNSTCSMKKRRSYTLPISYSYNPMEQPNQQQYQHQQQAFPNSAIQQHPDVFDTPQLTQRFANEGNNYYYSIQQQQQQQHYFQYQQPKQLIPQAK